MPATLAATLVFPKRKWEREDPGGDIDITYRAAINHAVVNVECEMNRFDPIYFPEIQALAFDLARTAINLFIFATGTGLRVVFDYVIPPNGIPILIVVSRHELGIIYAAYNFMPDKSEDLEIVAEMVVSDFPLLFAINDLTESIVFPRVAPVNCGRVVESIRQMISPNLKIGPAWEALRKFLNVSRPYIKFITNASKDPRHGDPYAIPHDIGGEAIQRTWIIMNCYIEFKKAEQFTSH